MGSKKNSIISLPDDVGQSFEEEDDILNFKPIIDFVEPPQIGIETADIPEVPETIDSLRDRTQKLINGMKGLAKLSDIAQNKIDKRVESLGGLTVKLDAKVDFHVISAMKRACPEIKDPTKITYECYKKALDCINSHSSNPPSVSAEDIKAAKGDSNRTDFGGISNQQGENRAEISSPAKSVEPLDLTAFQAAAVVALFALMLPLITVENQKAVAQHLVTVPHI